MGEESREAQSGQENECKYVAAGVERSEEPIENLRGNAQ